MGFVFIEVNVKKWGLVLMIGMFVFLFVYGSEWGFILFELGYGMLGVVVVGGVGWFNRYGGMGVLLEVVWNRGMLGLGL